MDNETQTQSSDIMLRSIYDAPRDPKAFGRASAIWHMLDLIKSCNSKEEYEEIKKMYCKYGAGSMTPEEFDELFNRFHSLVFGEPQSHE